jgi:DNA-binding transcriptional ArsR family regulator
MPDEIQDHVQLFKLLADETRVRILQYLAANGETNVVAICSFLKQSQPAVSHHLALLRVAGIIDTRRDGKHNHYFLVSDRITRVLALLGNAVEATQQEASTESKVRVFLCHGNEDKPAVRQLYRRLLRESFEPWFDEIDIIPGQEWEVAIRKAVASCHIVLVCLSSTSVQKTGYIQKEIRFALDRADELPEGAVFIIPVLLEACAVPDRLAKWQWVALYRRGGLNRLLLALSKVIAADN